MLAVSFENLLFMILPGQILYIEYLILHLFGRTYKLSSKTMRTDAVFHLNNRLSIPLNFVHFFFYNTRDMSVSCKKNYFVLFIFNAKK